MNKKHQVLIAAISIVALSARIVYAAGEWTVSKDEPSPFGVQVAIGHYSTANPDVSWVVPVGGKLEAVSWDNDPKCGEVGHVVTIKREGEGIETYPVPTAPLKPGKGCADPVDGLYSSRIFDVNGGDTTNGETGDDSGKISFHYKTYTPTPTNTSTDTPTNTSTPTDTPTDTPDLDTPTTAPTATDTPTNTPTPSSEPPDTAMPLTDTPTSTPTNTPTSTAEPPETTVPTADTPTPTSTSTTTAPSALDPITQPHDLFVVYAPWMGR